MNEPKHDTRNQTTKKMKAINTSQFRQYSSGARVDIYESRVYEGHFVAVDFVNDEIVAELYPNRERVTYSSGGFSTTDEVDIFSEALTGLVELAQARQ